MNGPQVRLAPVTVENWKACSALEPAPGQEEFLPSNLYSIAEAQFYADETRRQHADHPPLPADWQAQVVALPPGAGLTQFQR